ncbi:MAG: hypothetical protein ACFCU6_07630 [Balneolaceae bacterium]
MELKKYICILLSISFAILTVLTAEAQNSSDIELDLQAEPAFDNAQIIDVVSLAFDESGKGSRLFFLTLQNLSDSQSPALFIEYTVQSSRFGLIVEVTQNNNSPFNLEAGQIIVASNNDIAQSRLPGIPGTVRFNGNLTSSGQDFVNSLGASSRLPIDVYTITMQVFSGANQQNGGTFEVSRSITIGEKLVDDDQSIFLIAPGDVPGSDMTISNPFPEFRWEGRPDQTYRLVVVREIEGEGPETLIESALSTDAAQQGGTANLLQFEHIDVLLNGTSFQFPTTGAQPLRNGEKYYWQVFSTLSTTRGEELRSSEIWSFKLASSDANRGPDGFDVIEVDGDIFTLLSVILGEEKALELRDNGFRLDALELDEIEFSGSSAREQLELLLEKLRDGKLKFTNNPQ